jgi:hypothetical protein
MKVQGTTYKTLLEITARLALLDFDDRKAGPSDGRATEREALIAGLNEIAGGPENTRTLLENALYLARHAAPILDLSTEVGIVRGNAEKRAADSTYRAELSKDGIR